MLNYANLNDMEFEALCRDIMERMLGVSLRRFGPGKDGGVDLTDDVAQKEIIVQVKHYQKSDTSALIRSLKDERPKVDKLQPKKYYICCSTELSHNRITELYRHFEPYMDSDRHIVTLIEIDEFLHQEANRDILKRHFKLWLDDTGILAELYNDEIFVDCEALLSDVEELQKFFVRTSSFERALKVLESNQPLCIIGDPGVGKSITSKMLVLYYAAQNYRVRYTTDVTDLKALKKALRDESSTKEVILLDDCFGQAYFEMKASQSSELVSLIKYVKLHPNKVLILNSRVTIFQEARERQRDLVRCMEQKEFRIQVLDMNNLSKEERAKILYNHLAFCGIPSEYFEDIRKDHRYRDIISHRNYNPRIIEFVCSPTRYQNVPAGQFYFYIKKQLDNPREMWADEYDDRLQPSDRILLQTIYSMTTNTVSADLVRRCFERRIAEIPTIDKTLDQYNRSLMRLNEGFIKILDNRGTQELTMHNPSVNDFLDGRLREGSMERQALIDSICTDKQLLRLIPEKDRLPYAIDLLQTHKIDQFIFAEPRHRSRFIARSILSGAVYMDCYCVNLYDFLSMKNGYDYWVFSSPLEQYQIRISLQSPEMWQYYHLKEFFIQSNCLYTLLRQFSLDDAVTFIDTADEYFDDDCTEFFVDCVEQFLEDAISDYCQVDADDYDYLLDIDSAIDDATTITPQGSSIDISKAVFALESDVEDEVASSLSSILLGLPARFGDLWTNDYSHLVSVSGMSSLVESYLEENAEDPLSEDEDNHTEYSPIDAIFER